MEGAERAEDYQDDKERPELQQVREHQGHYYEAETAAGEVDNHHGALAVMAVGPGPCYGRKEEGDGVGQADKGEGKGKLRLLLRFWVEDLGEPDRDREPGKRAAKYRYRLCDPHDY